MATDSQNIFAEFQDEERKELIEQLLRLVPELAAIPRSTFFCLWFSDIKQLRELAAPTQDSIALLTTCVVLNTPSMTDVPGIFAGKKKAPKETVGRRKRRRGESECPDHDDPDSADNNQVREKAMKRDGNKCALTKHGRTTLHVAHIVPFKLHGSKREDSWKWLELFWGEDNVQEWKTKIMGVRGEFDTEKVHNMLSLACNVHTYWDHPLCAFRPVQENPDHTSMDIAFHWLPLPDKKVRRTDKIPINEHPYPELNMRTGLGDSPGEDIFVFDMKSKLVISSGHIFTITTNDPVERPLPSFQLLQMQWNLTRIAAMQGAGEDEDSDIDSDQDSFAVPSRSRSRSPSKHDRSRRSSENDPPFRSPGLSPSKKLQDLSFMEESVGSISEQ